MNQQKIKRFDGKKGVDRFNAAKFADSIFTIFAPKYMDRGTIEVNSAEAPKRISYGFRRECDRYRLNIEKSRRPGRRVIDNIDIGYLIPWENPLQLGINMLNPGGEVFVPAGTFTIQDTTITGIDKLKITGSGYASIIKAAKSAATSRILLTFSSKSNVEISHLHLWGDSDTIYSAGYATEFDHLIAMIGGGSIWVHDSWLIDPCGDGIYLSSDIDVAQINNNHIQVTNRDLGTSIGRNGIAAVEAKKFIVQENHLYYGFPAVIDLETNTDDDYTIENVEISHNTIVGGEGYGISVHASCATGGKTALVQKVRISNNNISDCDETGIIAWATASAGTATCKDVEIENNTLDNCDDGTDGTRISSIEVNNCDEVSVVRNKLIAGASSRIGIFIGLTSDYRCEQNDVRNFTSHGIHLYATSGNETSYSLLRGNKVKNSSYGNVGVSDGIKIDYSDKIIVDDNYTADDQGTPTQQFGLNIDNCDEIRLGRHYGDAFNTALMQLTNISGVRFTNLVHLGTFYHPSLAQNQSLTAMQLNGVAGGYIKIPCDGLLIAISANASGAVTAGTVTVEGDVNGVGLSGHKITITSSEGDENYGILGNTPKSVDEGDKVRLVIGSDASMTPDGTLNWWADIWLIPR